MRNLLLQKIRVQLLLPVISSSKFLLQLLMKTDYHQDQLQKNRIPAKTTKLCNNNQLLVLVALTVPLVVMQPNHHPLVLRYTVGFLLLSDLLLVPKKWAAAHFLVFRLLLAHHPLLRQKPNLIPNLLLNLIGFTHSQNSAAINHLAAVLLLRRHQLLLPHHKMPRVVKLWQPRHHQ